VKHFKIRLGVSPKQSGVFSAGNGPAMRSAIIGTLIPDDEELRRAFTIRSSQITHTDPKASHGALAIAEIAARLARKEWQSRPEVEKVESLLSSLADTNEWQGIVKVTTLTLRGEISLEDFAASLGGTRGVTGYVYHTVPYAIACWYLNFGNFETTIGNTIRGGGHTDSTAAIAGALAGLTCFQNGIIPSGWKDRILLWPIQSESFQNPGLKPAPLCKIWLRNFFFLFVILVHLVRRAFPPFG